MLFSGARNRVQSVANACWAFESAKMKDQCKEVFISHVEEEADLARELKGLITRTFGPTCRVFVSTDTAALPAGARWLDELDKALKRPS